MNKNIDSKIEVESFKDFLNEADESKDTVKENPDNKDSKADNKEEKSSDKEDTPSKIITRMLNMRGILNQNSCSARTLNSTVRRTRS